MRNIALEFNSEAIPFQKFKVVPTSRRIPLPETLVNIADINRYVEQMFSRSEPQPTRKNLEIQNLATN